MRVLFLVGGILEVVLISAAILLLALRAYIASETICYGLRRVICSPRESQTVHYGLLVSNMLVIGAAVGLLALLLLVKSPQIPQGETID